MEYLSSCFGMPEEDLHLLIVALLNNIFDVSIDVSSMSVECIEILLDKLPLAKTIIKSPGWTVFVVKYILNKLIETPEKVLCSNIKFIYLV